MSFRHLLTLLFFTITTSIFACDCNWGGNFIASTKKTPLIVKAKVTERLYHFEDGKIISSNNENEWTDYLFKEDQEYYQSIKVEVIQKLKGIEERKVFEIYGSNGYDCREFIHHFEIDKTYIFALYPSVNSEYNQLNEDENDYSIWGCSENWLLYIPETDEVKGYIFGKKRKKIKTVSVNKFIKKLR